MTGNVQAVYYLKNDKKKLQGANIIESASLKIISKEQKINQATFVKKPKGKVIPIKDVNPKEIELKGFSWQINRKPKSVEDLMK